MNKKKWLAGELAKWEAEGLLTPSAASAIRDRYSPNTNAGERRSWGIVVSCSIGALLVGLGIIALLAANWEFLTRPMRAAAAIAPVLACALAAYWAAAKKLRSRFFWETTGTLWMMAVIAALLIVATTYQVSDNSPALVMAMCVLTLPIVLLTRASLATVGWLALPIVWFSMKCAEFPHAYLSQTTQGAEAAKAYVAFLGLCAAGGVALLRTVLAGEYTPLTAFVQLGVAIALPVSAIVSIVIYTGVTSSTGGAGEIMGFLSALLAVAAIYHLGAMLRWKGLKIAALALIGWAFMMIPFNDAMYEIWRPFGTALHFSAAPLLPVAVNGAAAVILAALCGKERSKTLLAIPILYLAMGRTMGNDACAVVTYILALAWCAWFFMRGVRDDLLDRMNAGAIGLLYLIMAKFLASDASFTAKGIILIASGAALTAANVFIIRRRRSKGGAQ